MLMDALRQAGCRLHMDARWPPARQRETGNLATLDDGSQVMFDHALSAVGLPRVPRWHARPGWRSTMVSPSIVCCAPATRVSSPWATAPGPKPALAFHRTTAGADPGAGRHPDRHRDAAAAACPARRGQDASLPLVVCPPPPGTDGAWELDLGRRRGVRDLPDPGRC